MASNGQKQVVDSLLAKSRDFANKGQLLPYIETAIKALNLAYEADHEEGKAKGRFYLADGLVIAGLFKEGLKQLELVRLTKYYKEKTLMQSEVHRVRGRAYGGLMLYQQAIREFRLQLGLIKNLTGEYKIKSYQFTYENLSAVFDQTGELDSMQKYIELQLENARGLDEKTQALRHQIMYLNLARLNIRKKDFGKAQQYIDKSLALVKKYNIPVVYDLYTSQGDLANAKGDLKKAADFYEKSLTNKRVIGSRDGVKNTYRQLADFYQKAYLNKEKADQYELAFSRLNDSLERENRQVVDTVLNQILTLKDQESSTKVSKLITISIICLVLLVVAITFFLWRSSHNRIVFSQQVEALQETEKINKELTEQIGENKFNTLLELAKKNNPEFLTVFKELYPEFVQVLKSRDPNLRSTELEFCAMAFLNFSTKNIAEYTYVTIRAVQVRKNRLRKKFNIPSNADFNNWMRNQI